MRFKDKVVVVTGGAQGIGYEIALEFAKEAAKVVIFDLNQEQLNTAVGELKSSSEVLGIAVDVTNFEEVGKWANTEPSTTERVAAEISKRMDV